MRKVLLIIVASLAAALVSAPAAALVSAPAAAQEGDSTPVPIDPPPFSLPLSDDPGPDTWLYEQHYGNTISSYNYGDVWYEFGQGMHFGIDFEVACGTPVHAIADGVVAVVDADGFGAGPHNLVLEHSGTGYTSLYGHLLQQPTLSKGQRVQRGEVIGLSGDPDGSCGSRPHLHLEIRSDNYQIAYNPLDFFEVNWHMLASIGPHEASFQQDLDMPRRWMRLEDQPEIQFSGNLLNNYVHPWPLKLEVRAAANPPLARTLDPLPDDVTVTISPVTGAEWSVGAWWQPDDPDAVYVIDALAGQASGIFRQPLDGSARQYVQAPPLQTSPDGSITVTRNSDGSMQLTRTATGESWAVATNAVYPAISPGNTYILWTLVYGEIVPGTSSPGIASFVANLDGSSPRRVYSSPSIESRWLDDHRILVVRRIDYTTERRLYIVDLNDDDPEAEPLLLGAYDDVYDLRIAPGGEWIAFYRAFHDDPAANGVFVLRTEEGAEPLPLDVFGAYRWRDSESLYVLSYDIDQDAHALGVVDVESRVVRWLTDADEQPIRVANGEWSVSPDGARIVFLDPADYGLYVIDFAAE